jgi:hypothetical protein
MPRIQETNITRVKRHEGCISFKSHKPWKAQNSHETQKTWNIMKLRKLIKKLKAQES